MKFLLSFGLVEEFEKQILNLEQDSENAIKINKKIQNKKFKEKLVELINNKAKIYQFENSINNIEKEVINNSMKNEKVVWMDKIFDKPKKQNVEEKNSELIVPFFKEQDEKTSSKKGCSKSKSRKFLSNEALSTLRKWFLDNINHPYPK